MGILCITLKVFKVYPLNMLFIIHIAYMHVVNYTNVVYIVHSLQRADVCKTIHDYIYLIHTIFPS